jgi:exopolysaccharide biosynthesis polyprenyl glycosylphosphotransferase
MLGVKLQPRSVAKKLGTPDDSFGTEILNEKSFSQMLCLERKRTERSGRRFVLMLLESETLVRGGSDDHALDRVMRTLLQSTRETDIKGWYKENTVVGVIFTEVGPADGKTVATALLNRVTNALCATLSIDEINQIRVSFHVFPDDLAGGNQSGPLDLTLYPDQKSTAERNRIPLILKRGVDIVGSLAAVIFASPLLVAIALAIKTTSRGPIFFKQERVGRFGRHFTFLKFRSMYVENDDSIHRDYVTRLITGGEDAATNGSEGDKALFKIKNDPRVTRVGRILRRTSLDELPQFLNVLRGEMSLVGPRPPIPYEYKCYNTWHRRRLLTVKPGITGLWQIGGRSRVTFDEMVRLDLRYADTWSVLLDLKILLKTPAAVFSGDGAL